VVDEIRDVGEGHARALPKVSGEVVTDEELHHHVRVRAQARAEHPRNVGRVHLLGELRLTLEALDVIRIAEHVRVKELHRRHRAGVHVLGAVDLAHSAATKHVAEHEAADLASGVTSFTRSERAIEVTAGLGEESVALVHLTVRAVHLVDGDLGGAPTRTREEEGRREDRFDHDDEEPPPSPRERMHGQRPQIGEYAEGHAERKDEKENRSKRVRGLRGHRALAETKKVDAERKDHRCRGKKAKIENENFGAKAVEESDDGGQTRGVAALVTQSAQGVGASAEGQCAANEGDSTKERRPLDDGEKAHDESHHATGETKEGARPHRFFALHDDRRQRWTGRGERAARGCRSE
jgi:hypothetical protein